MDHNKINQLTDLLKRLNEGESSATLKREAKEFLASISPSDLSVAEQKLIEAGLAPEDLRHLCSVHMEMLDGELNKMKTDLAPGHVIHTLVLEHDAILSLLDEIEKVNQAIQMKEKYMKDDKDLLNLSRLAESLLGAEPHHQREEQVLFPEIESCGVFGPTKVMLMEHQDMRRYKREIKAACDAVAQTDFDEFKKKINASVKMIVMMLRDHIFKENNILYPTALDVLKDPERWSRMKSRCDEIGYCDFTPLN